MKCTLERDGTSLTWRCTRISLGDLRIPPLCDEMPLQDLLAYVQFFLPFLPVFNLVYISILKLFSSHYVLWNSIYKLRNLVDGKSTLCPLMSAIADGLRWPDQLN
jgi:hypothetical protein